MGVIPHEVEIDRALVQEWVDRWRNQTPEKREELIRRELSDRGLSDVKMRRAGGTTSLGDAIIESLPSYVPTSQRELGEANA